MPESHGSQRAQRVTASVARTIMSGNQQSWETLARKLWADDGSQFDAGSSSGPCAHGHEHEEYAKGKFWLRHPDMELSPVKFVKFRRPGYSKDHPYVRLLGCSPDMCLMWGHVKPAVRLAGGGEIKSPTTEGTFRAYAADMSRGHLPRDHEDQVRFSLWVTRWPCWFFVTHFGEDDNNYRELIVLNNTADQRHWEARFKPRIDAFLKFYIEGEQPQRDKLGGDDLAKLLGG